MKITLPKTEDMKDFDIADARQRQYWSEEYDQSKPFLERLLAIHEELEQIKKDLRESNVWSLLVPDYEVESAIHEMGFYDTWLPSTQDC